MEQEQLYCGTNIPIDDCYPYAFTDKFTCISKVLPARIPVTMNLLKSQLSAVSVIR